MSSWRISCDSRNSMLIVACVVLLHRIAATAGLGAGQGAADDAVDQGRFAGKCAGPSIRGRKWCAPNWTNLNGLWDYAIRPEGRRASRASGTARSSFRFAVESALSGVKKPVTPDERLWYRRTFDNRRQLTEGGRCCFTLARSTGNARCGSTARKSASTRAATIRSRSISPMRCNDGEERTRRRRLDPTDTGTQPRGKQVLKPHGIWYTAVTGIWQTVGSSRCRRAHQVAQDRARRRPQRGHGDRRCGRRRARARARANDGRSNVGEAEGPSRANRSSCKIAERRNCGRPIDPQSVRSASRAGRRRRQVVDAVDSYFGLRKIEVRKDAEGINRLCSTTKSLFQYGPLDQGWWPDGLYTPATDEGAEVRHRDDARSSA